MVRQLPRFIAHNNIRQFVHIKLWVSDIYLISNKPELKAPSMRSYCQPISMPANSSQATPSQFWCGYSILLWCSVLSSPVPVLVARRIQSVICENCLETRFSSYIRAISFRKFAVHQLDEGAFSRSQLQFIKGINCQVTKPKRLRSDHSCHIWAQNDCRMRVDHCSKCDAVILKSTPIHC